MLIIATAIPEAAATNVVGKGSGLLSVDCYLSYISAYKLPKWIKN
jgi:hypothetical protein